MNDFCGRAHQQGAARHLPARHLLGLHGRRRGRHGRRPLADAQARRHRRRRACTARPPSSARSSRSSPSLGVIVTGDIQGKIMTEVQPMKMAAAEGAVRHHEQRAASRSCRSARSTAARPPGSSRSPACSPSSRPARFDGDGRGHQRPPGSEYARPEGRRAVRPAGRRPGHRRRLRADHPGDLLVVPAHDGPGLPRHVASPRSTLWATRKGRVPAVASGGSGSRCSPRSLRSSRTASAGSSPRSAVSRGSSTA